VGTKPRRNVHIQGAELAARTKGFSAKPISRVLGLLWIRGVARSSHPHHTTFTEMFLKSTTRSIHVQVTIHTLQTKIKIHVYLSI